MSTEEEIEALHTRLDTMEHTVVTLQKTTRELQLKFDTLLRSVSAQAKKLTPRQTQAIRRVTAARARERKAARR